MIGLLYLFVLNGRKASVIKNPVFPPFDFLRTTLNS